MYLRNMHQDRIEHTFFIFFQCSIKSIPKVLSHIQLAFYRPPCWIFQWYSRIRNQRFPRKLNDGMREAHVCLRYS